MPTTAARSVVLRPTRAPSGGRCDGRGLPPGGSCPRRCRLGSRVASALRTATDCALPLTSKARAAGRHRHAIASESLCRPGSVPTQCSRCFHPHLLRPVQPINVDPQLGPAPRPRAAPRDNDAARTRNTRASVVTSVRRVNASHDAATTNIMATDPAPARRRPLRRRVRHGHELVARDIESSSANRRSPQYCPSNRFLARNWLDEVIVTAAAAKTVSLIGPAPADVPSCDSGIENSMPVVTSCGLPVVRRVRTGPRRSRRPCCCCRIAICKVDEVVESAMVARVVPVSHGIDIEDEFKFARDAAAPVSPRSRRCLGVSHDQSADPGQTGQRRPNQRSGITVAPESDGTNENVGQRCVHRPNRVAKCYIGWSMTDCRRSHRRRCRAATVWPACFRQIT